MQSRHYLSLGVLVFIATCVYVWARPGDGDAVDRLAVRGEVTYNGQPLKSGRIQFTPDRDTDAPAVTGTIENGKFRIRPADGLFPGGYEVTIKLPRLSKEDVMRRLKSKTKLGNAANDDQGQSSILGDIDEVFHWPHPQVVPADADEVVVNISLPAGNVSLR